MMIKNENYTLRIASASPVQLVVINYELTIAFIQEALDIGNTITSSDVKAAFQKQIKKAQNGLQQLIDGLNFEISIAQDLYQLYSYINQLLITAYYSGNAESLSEAKNLLYTLLIGWKTVATDEKNARPAMENAPQVYAGLTYHKGGLSEYQVPDDTHDYKA